MDDLSVWCLYCLCSMWRHFIAWLGSMPATSHNFKKLLKKGSVAVIGEMNTVIVAYQALHEAHCLRFRADGVQGKHRYTMYSSSSRLLVVLHMLLVQ